MAQMAKHLHMLLPGTSRYYQIPKSPNQRHLKVKDVKDKSISALQLTLTPSSGIASIALDVSNPKQRHKGHMSHMLGSHASSASPAKVTSWQSPSLQLQLLSKKLPRLDRPDGQISAL